MGLGDWKGAGDEGREKGGRDGGWRILSDWVVLFRG